MSAGENPHSTSSQSIPTLPPNPSYTSSSSTSATETATPSEPNIKITTHYQYTSPRLSLSDLSPSSPISTFKTWFSSASSVREPEAMCLSTVSLASGYPSSRMVLLRGVDEKGFVFFTNYNSRKSGELEQGGKAAINFYWKEISRQVRVVGTVEKVDERESDEYFNSRPRGSQLGAHASEQSKVIGDTELEERMEVLEREYEGKDVDRPKYWGGWRVIPREMEFWAGHSSRLHDRYRYQLKEDGSWQIDRLAP